jgi:DNA-binding beta-propeller fold protein YncE
LREHDIALHIAPRWFGSIARRQMENSTTTQKPSRVISKLRLSAIALVSVVTVFMVTMLIAATGDNIADAVLGQIDFSHNGINNTGAASLESPGQMAIDLSGGTEHLYIVDGNNSRILGWNDATSFVNGQNADIEIGQPDFRTTRCNSGTGGGDLAGLGPDSLCLPGGVAVDSAGNLYIADTLNSRVLEYNQPFTQGISVGFAANVVFGQGGSFTQTTCAQTAAGLCSPQGVATDSSNKLYVADAGNHRVLEYNAGYRLRTSSLDKARAAPTSPAMLATPAALRQLGCATHCRSPWTGREICTSATTAIIACSNSISRWRRPAPPTSPPIWSSARARAEPILPTPLAMTAMEAIPRLAPPACAT